MDLVITYHDPDSGTIRTLVAADTTPQLAQAYRELRQHRDPGAEVALFGARQRLDNGRFEFQRDWMLTVAGIAAVEVEYLRSELEAPLCEPPPVDRLTVTRDGASMVATWLWPGSVDLVEVSWAGPDGPPTTWQVTRSRYACDGNAAKRLQPEGGTLHVTSLRITPDHVYRGPTRRVAFAAEPLTLTCHLVRAKRLRILRRYEVVVRTNQACAGMTLHAQLDNPDDPRASTVLTVLQDGTLSPDSRPQFPLPLRRSRGRRHSRTLRYIALLADGSPVDVHDMTSTHVRYDAGLLQPTGV